MLNQKLNQMEDFIKTINVYDYERFRDEVIRRCNVTRSCWSNWRNGKIIPDAKYQPIIDEVATEMFKRTIFNNHKS